ncbi:MAG TPA: class I SAM-dependent methyltransferase [Intrasporangium sp.]|nr:class I SAM-dependent methyltransferase [Intrasporangium sp.]
MQQSEIEAIHRRHWRPGYGSIAADEVDYVQELIAEHRPRHFIEVGMASGLSGGLICLLLDEYGGETFTTLDHDNSFFGDRSKENGFLIDEIYHGDRIHVEKKPFTLSMQVPELGRTFDMAFVDANHQHPWPTIDTLCLYPYMSGSKMVLHHDLKLYKDQRVPHGIGPKYLYDQFPEELRHRAPANRGNLFSLRLTLPREELEELAVDSLLLPWSIRHTIRPRRIAWIHEFLDAHYSARVRQAFDLALERYNVGSAGPRPDRATG